MKQPAVLEHLHYIAKRTFKGHVLFIAFSALSDPKMVERISMPIRAYEQLGSCTAFALHNNDRVLFFNNNKAHHLMLLALKIKEITGVKTYEKIVASYDLKKEYGTLHNRIYQLVLAPDTAKLHNLSVMSKIPHKPFMWEDLSRALTHLDSTSLTHLIRKQTAISVHPQTFEDNLFTTWFVDLADIRRILIPDVDMKQNLFFYQLLREAVDKKVLQKITQIPSWTGSVNISVDAFKLPMIKDWLVSHDIEQKKRILFEFSFDDIVLNRMSYHYLRSVLGACGYRFVIRLKSLMPALNGIGLPADYIKIPFEFLPEKIPSGFTPDDMIVCNVQEEKDIETLRQKGLYQIQGPAITPRFR
ncbi:MAG: hypothetical protein IKY98_03340 [Alphaproteobacteria bacterium]|nr:hypothetical protein [Alphaproteobacteria bacterium]